MDQICPKWIKMDQTWSNWIHYPKFSTFSTFYKFLIFLSIYLPFIIKANIFRSDLSKMDQNGSNLIKLEFSPIKKCCYKKLSHLPWRKEISLYLWSDWIRTVQNGSNLIKLDQAWSNRIGQNLHSIPFKNFLFRWNTIIYDFFAFLNAQSKSLFLFPISGCCLEKKDHNFNHF